MVFHDFLDDGKPQAGTFGPCGDIGFGQGFAVCLGQAASVVLNGDGNDVFSLLHALVDGYGQVNAPLELVVVPLLEFRILPRTVKIWFNLRNQSHRRNVTDDKNNV